LGQLEEGLAILDEALLLVDETEEHLWEAELHRLRAELLLGLGDETQAGAVFQRAIEVARRQQARSWELRAATGLARLWMRQGKDEQARELLAPIYGWFTEGFDTPDLVEARELLSGRTSSPSGDRQS
jgi:predicted ATPase